MTLKAKWLLENAYIKTSAKGANSRPIGLSLEIISNEFQTYPSWSLDYSINKVIVGATKPTTGIVKSEDWSSSKNNSIVKSRTKYNLLIAVEDPRTIINLPNDSSYLFADLFADSITFNSNVNYKNVVNMAYMFSFSASNINLKNLNTSNVTNMSDVFSLLFPVSSHFWPEVLIEDKDIEKLFHQREPYAMTTIQGIESLNIFKVKDMSYIFTTQWFNSLDLSKWNTENVTDMSYMFAGINANKLVLSNFKMTKVQYDKNMFGYNESTSFDNLENCDLSLVFYNTKISTIVNKNSDLTNARIKELFTKFSCSSKTL
jgi:surface protein